MEKKTTTLDKEKRELEDLRTDDLKHDNYDMLVFCHLRWGFVYQRPQHLISRMAKNYRILLVEEPIPYNKEEENSWDLEIIDANLHVLKPKATGTEGIAQVLRSFLSTTSFEVGWFYSAWFSPLLSEFNFEKVVYDCMDELSLFKGAPSELIQQEKFLLSEADIVFTGGKSLYESKSNVHQNVHCFQSSVEREHFEKALTEIEIPEDIKEIKGPIVGYFGVIDERIDLDLLHSTAILRPEVNFVMIGPLAKIAEEDLPKEKNIHYLGMKSYKDLPNYLKAFDIAMMPFALNDATKFISPTKTLEYMAAGIPIISTAVKDVIRDYAHCIPIVKNAEEFSKDIDQLMNADHSLLKNDFDEILKKTSWDNTAASMKQLLKTTIK